MSDRELVPAQPLLATKPAATSDPDRLLHAIEQWEPSLNAFVHLDPSALERAGHSDGPLAGHVVAVKDNIAVRGAPYAAGSASRLGSPATKDAELVRRLRVAGAAIIGTTNLDELAMGASTESSHWGPTRNPWDRTRTPGGSSGGSAAAVAAYGVLSVGSDTGGSIREPAAQCGVVGVKPSQRAIPQDDVVPFAPSCDEIGPLGPDLASTALLDDVLRGGGSEMRDAVRRGQRDRRLPDLRIGVVLQQSDERNSPEVRRRFERALGLLSAGGAILDEISFPSIRESLRVYLDITSVEAIPVLEAHEHRGAGLAAESLRRLEHARGLVGTARLGRAKDARVRIRRQLLAAAGRYHVMLSPTMPITAPRLGAAGLDDPLGAPRTDWWTVEANLAGLGALSLPCGLGADSALPVGLQLMAGPGLDRRLYSVGAWLEAAGAAAP